MGGIFSGLGQRIVRDIATVVSAPEPEPVKVDWKRWRASALKGALTALAVLILLQLLGGGM